jgi:hypothetical protein
MIPTEGRRSQARIWQLVGGLGLCLAVAGGIDIGLGLFPLQFGVTEWEFGGVGSFLNRLPLFGLGLTFLLSASLARRARATALLTGSLLLLLAVVVFVLGVLFATTAPLVLASQTAEPLRGAVLKAVAKGGFQSLVYFLAFFAVSVYAIRAALRRR